MRISFDTSVLTERLSAFKSSSSMSSPTSIINLLPASVFSYDGCCFWTGALVTDVICGDDGVVTVVDDGTGVMMHPVFVNVVAIELETEGDVLISVTGSAGPDVPATDGLVVLDTNEPCVTFA